MSTLRIATTQVEPVWYDLAATTEKTIDIIHEAAGGGAAMVALPETWLPGYPLYLWSNPLPEQLALTEQYRANSPELDGPEITAIREAARRDGIQVVLGLSERSHGSLYMAQIVIGADGSLLQHRRKLKPTHMERTIFGEGDGSGLHVIETPIARVGALNCWEHLQPLVKFTMYAQHEQIHVAGWPAFGTFLPQLGAEVSLATSRTYAVEGSVFVAVSNLVVSGSTSDTSGVVGGGVARIFGPNGSLLTEPLDGTVEGIVYADIDLADIDAAKAFADPVGHYSRPDVFQLTVDRTPRRPALLNGAPAAAEYLETVELIDALA